MGIPIIIVMIRPIIVTDVSICFCVFEICISIKGTEYREIVVQKRRCISSELREKCFKSPKNMERKEEERNHFTSVDVLVCEKGKGGSNFKVRNDYQVIF
jgi:hypothetical protein